MSAHVIMAPHFVLFEHAAGYALFRLQEFEEIATFQPQVEASVADVSKFSQVVNLVAFSPFKAAADALSNINSVSEGLVHDDLKLFLDTNMPKVSIIFIIIITAVPIIVMCVYDVTML